MGADGGDPRRVRVRSTLLIASIGQHLPGEASILDGGLQYDIDLFLEARILYRHDGLDALAGRNVHLRRSSSYRESLGALNRSFAGRGLDPVELEPVAEYLEALEKSKRLAKTALDSTLREHDLDALIAPTNSPAWLTDHINGDSYHVGSSSLAAISGYPNITVPAGFILTQPVGISFMGAEGSDREMINIAYAFEQVAHGRRAPGY